VEKAGFAAPLPPDPAPLRTFRLAAGQTLADVNVSLQRSAVITGQVLDPSSGEPVAGTMVVAMRQLSALRAPTGMAPIGSRFVRVGSSAQTNDLGEFRIFNLPPGEYFVAATRSPTFGLAVPPVAAGGNATRPAASSTAIVTTFYPGTADPSFAQPVTVGAGQVANGIFIRLLTAPTYQVSGTVVDENGSPLAGAMVVLRNDPRTSVMGPLSAGNGRSDARGQFVISGITSGSYMATASVPVAIARQNSSSGIASFSTTTINRLPTSTDVAITVSDSDVAGLQVVAQRPQ
jgi:hypothetical protein